MLSALPWGESRALWPVPWEKRTWTVILSTFMVRSRFRYVGADRPLEFFRWGVLRSNCR